MLKIKFLALQEERKLLTNEPRNTRRGVLMAQLQEAAKCTPLWIGGPNDSKPPLCGALPAAPKHEIVVGSKVAAKVDGAGENEPPNWILAKFVSYDAANMVTVWSRQPVYEKTGLQTGFSFLSCKSRQVCLDWLFSDPTFRREIKTVLKDRKQNLRQV